MEYEEYGDSKRLIRGVCAVFHTAVFRKDTPHKYDTVYIGYIANGGGTLELDGGEKIALEPGEIFILNPHTVHTMRPDDNTRCIDVYSCHFNTDKIGKQWAELAADYPDCDEFFSGDRRYLLCRDTPQKLIRDVFVRLIDETMYRPRGYEDVVLGYFRALLVYIFRGVENSDFKRVYSSNYRVDLIISRMHASLYKPFSMSELAKDSKVSESYICRLFKQHTGMTAAQYMTQLRVDTIKDFLRNTDKPIERITAMFFVSPEYIMRMFKKETGMTMSEYRKKYHYLTGVR